MLRFYLVTSCLLSLLLGDSFVRAKLLWAEGKAQAHVVQAGQTLWEIARSYDCSVAEVQSANDLDGKLIQPGQELAIPRCPGASSASSARAQGTTAARRADPPGRTRTTPLRSESGLYILSHEVESGDTLYDIARRYDTSVEDLRARNAIDSNFIRPGQELRVAVGKDGQGRPIPGQSVGSASHGRLSHGMQLPTGRGYYRRRPHRAWGANHTIYHVRRAVSVVRRRFPEVHDLAIGDISSKRGGPLADHKSHQSGRDVDIGLYYKKRPEGYPKSFFAADARDIDLAAMWMLVETLADTTNSASGVELMFLDYDLQKALYEYARSRGVSKGKLRRVFQYPRGRTSPSGTVRHEPGHDSHVHVRFKCPKDDDGCR